VPSRSRRASTPTRELPWSVHSSSSPRAYQTRASAGKRVAPGYNSSSRSARMNEVAIQPGTVTAGLHYTVDTGVKPVNETFGPNNIRRRVSASMKCGR